MSDACLPSPPFTSESAAVKVRKAEGSWNTCGPQAVSLAYAEDSRWRNRAKIFQGREVIVASRTRKWQGELDYRLAKELWAFGGNCIAVHLAYESHHAEGQWLCSYGNENWEFNDAGLKTLGHASINDLRISVDDRRLTWNRTADARRPDDNPSRTARGLQAA